MLRTWLKERHGQPDEPLFPDPAAARPLSRDAVERDRRTSTPPPPPTTARRFSAKHVTPHTLRHTAAMGSCRARASTSR